MILIKIDKKFYLKKEKILGLTTIVYEDDKVCSGDMYMQTAALIKRSRD